MRTLEYWTKHIDNAMGTGHHKNIEGNEQWTENNYNRLLEGKEVSTLTIANAGIATLQHIKKHNRDKYDIAFEALMNTDRFPNKGKKMLRELI